MCAKENQILLFLRGDDPFLLAGFLPADDGYQGE